MMEPLMTNRKWQFLLSIPIFIYFASKLIWSTSEQFLATPESTEKGNLFRERFLTPVRFVIDFWRLDENWRLFSPIIRDINFHNLAIITFADQTKMAWEIARNNPVGLTGTYHDEKWRKWSGDNMPWKSTHKNMWPDLARWVGRRFYNPANPPVSFTLCMWWTPLPKPTEKGPLQYDWSQDHMPFHTLYSGDFIYKYSDEDFK